MKFKITVNKKLIILNQELKLCLPYNSMIRFAWFADCLNPCKSVFKTSKYSKTCTSKLRRQRESDRLPASGLLGWRQNWIFLPRPESRTTIKKIANDDFFCNLISILQKKFIVCYFFNVVQRSVGKRNPILTSPKDVTLGDRKPEVCHRFWWPAKIQSVCFPNSFDDFEYFYDLNTF